MAKISTILNILTYFIALIGFAPLFPFLGTVPSVVFPAALICGFLADRKGKWLSGSLPTIVSILFFVFYASQLGRANIAGPAANLLTLLLSVRLISEKKARNYLQIFALSLFSLASSSLFALDAMFLVYLIALLFLVAVALVFLTFHGADNDMVMPVTAIKKTLSFACLMPAAALPLICIFFMILPRTQYPLWNFLNAAGSNVTGFSEKVQPGTAASVTEVKSAVFRAECRKLPKDELYWRGSVLNTFAGNAWVRGELPAGETGQVNKTRAVYQTIYPETGWSGHLFALNVPFTITGIRAQMTGDLVLKGRSGRTGRIRYDVISAPESDIRTAAGIDRGYYLRLPIPLSPRMASLGDEIARNGKNDAAKVELLKEYYLSSGITYATSDLPVSADPLDEFLFVKKRGNCEFFASSFALLLRAAGVPSRLVGGYYGGEYNELGGYYLVTEDCAHVWVEAFISGQGWVTIDPSTLSTGFRRLEENRPSGVVYRLGMYIDSFNYYWNRAVISYDLERQFSLIRSANFRIRQFPVKLRAGKFLQWLAVPIVMALLIFTVARAMGASREEKILRRFLRIMKRKYSIGIYPATGLHELAALSGEPSAKRFAAVYCAAVYSDRKLTTGEYRLLEELLRNM
jgi:protein-glutamine gamma-glutamyltransferase